MSDLKEVNRLANQLIDKEALIAEKQEELRQLQTEYRQIAEVDLPTVMEEIGMADFTLSDGRKVEIDVSFHASITEANRAAAFKWLRENNRGGIIKRAVSMEFGKGEDDKAQKYVDWLKKKYPDREDKIKDAESVHPQTLKAFVREMMEEGEELPESISVFRKTEAKIKQDNKAKKKAAGKKSAAAKGKDGEDLW